MATSLVPLLTTAPAHLFSYSPEIAYTHSWVPMNNSQRRLYAQSVYVVNDQAGITYSGDTNNYFGDYISITTLQNTKFDALTALNSDIAAGFYGVTLPAGTVIKAPIKGFKLGSGAVIAQKG